MAPDLDLPRPRHASSVPLKTLMPNQHDPEGHHPSRSHRALQAVRSHVQPGSFPLLLGAGLLLYVLNGLAVASMTGAVLVQVARAGVACAGIYVLSASRTTLWLGAITIALSITFAARVWGLDPRVNRVLQDATATGFLLWVLAVVLREVFRPSTRERDAVVGALCGFVLILMAFMRVHGLLEALSPGSYAPSISERSDATLVAVFQYFSTVTLTTVGFGVIVPVAPAARLVTGLEAIVGQLYLAVVIATLVGRAAARRE